MNKTEAIDKMIETIYNNNSDLIMTEIDVKKLNEFFKSSLVFIQPVNPHIIITSVIIVA